MYQVAELEPDVFVLAYMVLDRESWIMSKRGWIPDKHCRLVERLTFPTHDEAEDYLAAWRLGALANI